MSWKIKVLTSALLLNAFGASETVLYTNTNILDGFVDGKVDGFVDGKVCLN